MDIKWEKEDNKEYTRQTTTLGNYKFCVARNRKTEIVQWGYWKMGMDEDNFLRCKSIRVGKELVAKMMGELANVG